MNIFLRMKHWQLFLLLFGIPFLFQTISIKSMNYYNNPAIIFMALPIIIILYMAGFFSWFYALGTNLNRKLPDTFKMNLVKFRILLFVPITYTLLICVFLFGLFRGLLAIVNSGSPDPSALAAMQPGWGLVVLIIPLHFFAMFCILHSFYFIAKSLKLVEGQRAVVFSDFAGEFLLIWCFPVGIWIIQPRINRLFAEDTYVSSRGIENGG